MAPHLRAALILCLTLLSPLVCFPHKSGSAEAHWLLMLSLGPAVGLAADALLAMCHLCLVKACAVRLENCQFWSCGSLLGGCPSPLCCLRPWTVFAVHLQTSQKVLHCQSNSEDADTEFVRQAHATGGNLVQALGCLPASSRKGIACCAGELSAI